MDKQNQAIVDLKIRLGVYRANHKVACEEERVKSVHTLAHKISDTVWAIRLLEQAQDMPRPRKR